MEKIIYILKNSSSEGPGLLEPILISNNIKYKILDLDGGDLLPNIEDISCLISLGAPDSANDQSEKILKELELIKAVINLNLPYLGICLGLQVLVKACGGSVVRNHCKEIGFRDLNNELFNIELTDIGKKDPIFSGLNNTIPVFQVHGETVVVKSDMQLLATGKTCTNQVVKVANNAYGFQCHFELTNEMFLEWIKDDPDLAKINKEEILIDYKNVKTEYEHTAKIIFNNFLKISNLIS